MDTIFDSNDKDTKFNSFLNTYLRIFYLSFTFKRIKNETNKTIWITRIMLRIKTSHTHKRELYLVSRGNNDPKLKKITTKYIVKFCEMLSREPKT
jgi:hypothetical protein